MKDSNKKFSTSKEFGAFLGLSDLDMKLIQQKKKLIEKLKKARIDQEISQSELAKMMKTKQPAIARMESGLVSEVSLDFLAKIAIVLGVSFTFKSAKAA
jgi:ribosome-binding protein aMBF1 (putative translation factor)